MYKKTKPIDDSDRSYKITLLGTHKEKQIPQTFT